MQVTLKKAAALAAALTGLPVKIDHQYSVDPFADPPSQAMVVEFAGKMQTQVEVALGIVDAAFVIRDMIGKANVGKINQLLTERAAIEKKLSIINGIPSRNKGTNLDALTRKVEAGREEKAPAFGRGNGLTLDLETETLILPIQKELKRQKRRVEEELQTLNFNTTIELPKGVVDVLTELDLV